MIAVTRLNGIQFYLNAETILMVETTPDTVITLVNDRKIVVSEPAEVVVDRLIEYQRKVHQPFPTREPAGE